MLSSTMVSVIAPHWSERFRRHKKGLVGSATGEAEQEAQRSEQEVDEGGRVSTLCNPQERASDPQNQPAGERGEIPGSQAQERAPSLGISRGTLGWLDERNPNSLKPPISSPLGSPQTPTSPLSPQLHGNRRMSPASHHGDKTSSPSSKPTTSSILLSLRRFNSNWINSNIGSTHSEATPPTLSSLTSDRAPGSPTRPHRSRTSPNDMEGEQLKSPLSSSSTSCRLPQTSGVYPTQAYSAKQTILASGLERLSSSEGPDQNRTAEVDPTSSQTSQRGRLDWKSHSLPRGTMLSSTSWWKHEESDFSPCSHLKPTNNNVNNNNKENTSIFSFPSSNKNYTGPQTTHSNASCSPQNINNMNNNNLSQSATPNNLNHMLRDTQVKTSPFIRSKAQDLPDQRSHTSLLTQPALSPVYPKSHSLSSLSYNSKISSALSPVTFTGSTINLTRPETSPDYRPCRSNVVDTEQFHLSSKNREPSTSTSLSCSTSPQTSNTPDSLYTSPNSRLPFRPHSPHRVSPGRTSVVQDYLLTIPKSPTPSSVLSSQRSTEKRTPTSRSISLASYPRNPFNTSVSSVPRPISTNHPPSLTTTFTPSSTHQPIHPQPTSAKPPLPSKATPTPTRQPLSPITNYTSTSPILSDLLLPQDNSLPLGERTFTRSLVLSPKKQCSVVEGRGIAGPATWRNSVEPQPCNTITRGGSGSSESPPVQTSPMSPSRPHRSIEGPSIFASLRSGSPSRAVSPLSPPGARACSLQVWRGDREMQREREEMEGRENEKESVERSVLSGSSDRSSRFTFNPLERDWTTGAQRKWPEERISCPRSAAGLSLPSDVSSGRKLSFISPPYQNLKANSPPQGEVQRSTRTPSSPSYKPPTSPPNSLPISPLYSLPISPPVSPYSPALSQQSTGSGQDSTKVVATETDSVNNNYYTTKTNQAIQDAGAPHPPCIETPIDYISPQPFPLAAVEDMLPPPSSRVTVIETLVYMIPKASSYAGSTSCVRLSHSYTATSELSQTSEHSQVIGHSSCKSQQSFNETSAVGTQWPLTIQAEAEKEVEREGRQERNNVLDRKNMIAPTQSSNRGLFGLKVKRESVVSSTHAAGLDTERETVTAQSERDMRETEGGHRDTERRQREIDKRHSGTTKMDLLSRLKQTLNIKRSDDELMSSHLEKRASPATSDPSVTPGDEITAEAGKQREDERWRESKISPKPSSGQWRREEIAGEREGTEQGNRSAERVKKERSPFGVLREERVEESRQRPSMATLSPTGLLHSDLYEGDRLDDVMAGGLDGRLDGSQCQSRQLPPRGECSPAGLQPWIPNLPSTLPTRRASSASPRSPNSPFSSLGHKISTSSPLSSFSSSDCQVSGAPHLSSSSPLSREEWGSDSVFLSPVLSPTGGRRKATSLCEPVEEEEVRGQGSGLRGRDRGRLASLSSCADLKYGLEAGRSFSVSSVLSSRPSGTGRISRGTRVASASDLTDLPMTSGDGDWMTKSDFRSDSKSKSLPRSLLRSSTWGSEVPGQSPTVGQVWGPSCLDSTHFPWDTEGPLTPPPSPPWSPASRRMSRPPNSSPPSSAGSKVLQDSQTSRGRLPTRGYFSSLSVFDESGQDQDSDVSSDTTTDDEYCLGGEEEEEEKETEL